MGAKYFDLTHPFASGMPVFPGDPPVEIAIHANNDCILKTGMHAGTHIDAPLHMIENGKRICDFPAEKFIGRGRIIDARGARRIDANLLENTAVAADEMLFIVTDWDAKFGKPGYYENYPEMTEAFAQKAISRGIKMIGMDTPSPDSQPFPIHKLFLAKDILIIENLTNLSALLHITGFEVSALPMRIAAEASPARVIACYTPTDG